MAFSRLTIIFIICASGLALPLAAQQAPALAVQNVSTDRSPMVLVSWSDSLIAPWQQVTIERSATDSIWQTVGIVRSPAASMVDSSVISRETYRYRARRFMADHTLRIEWGDTVTTLPDVMIDLLDYLIPRPRIELVYEYSHNYLDDHIWTRTRRYRAHSAVQDSDHVHIYPFRYIDEREGGVYDTLICSIACNYDSLPRLDLQGGGYWGWGRLSLFFAPWWNGHGGSVSIVGDAGKDLFKYSGERFISSDSLWTSSGRETIWIGYWITGSPIDYGAGASLKRDFGIFRLGYRSDGMTSHYRDTMRLVSTTSAGRVQTPAAFTLDPISPHPVSTTATLSINLYAPGTLRITVHDLWGRAVARMTDGFRPAGRHVFRLDAAGLKPGLYFVRAVSGESVMCRKIMLLR